FINTKLKDPGIVPDTMGIVTAQQALAAAPTNNNEVERKALIKEFADSLATYFIRLAKDDLLNSTVQNALSVPENLVPVLLQNVVLTTPAITSPKPLNEILEETFVPLPDPDTDNKSRALNLVQVLNEFVATLKISPDRVKWMLANNAALGV